MALGYKVKLDGMGVFFNEFITTGSVNNTKEVTAKLIKSVRPAFNPEYTIVNSSFRYALLPKRTELVRIEFNSIPSQSEGSESPNEI